MDYVELMEQARPRLGENCKGCLICNGRACGNKMPGPGAKGIGDTAIRNYEKWKEIRINMDTLVERKPVDMSLDFFGKRLKYPIIAGPVGLVAVHYSDAYTDTTYNDVLVSGCAAEGIVRPGHSHRETLGTGNAAGEVCLRERQRRLCLRHGRGRGRSALFEKAEHVGRFQIGS